MMAWLNWPDEQATPANRELPRFGQYAALQLDLHGDPLHAKLVVFSDGNHHMALHDALQAFALAHPGVGEIGAHPGYVDEELALRDTLVGRRADELALLTAPLLLTALGGRAVSWRVVPA